MRLYPFGLVVDITPRIQIAIETREVTAGYLDTNAMPLFEVITGRHWAHLDFVDFPLFHEHFFIKSIAIARAENGLVQIISFSVGMYIDELDGEIGILGI